MNEALQRSSKLFENSATIELITTDELAARLRIASKTIRNWQYRGEIPASCSVKIGGKLLRYRWDKILNWINPMEVDHECSKNVPR